MSYRSGNAPGKRDPAKPLRPSHVLHTFLAGTLRVVLDVQISTGKQLTSGYAKAATMPSGSGRLVTVGLRFFEMLMLDFLIQHPRRLCRRLALLALAALPALPLHAQESALGAAELAKQLANPVASMISVPLQFNWDSNIGPDDVGRRFTMNIQPVIPASVGTDWNLITRVILPVVDQSDIAPGAGSQFGLGDTTASVWLSPKLPSANGWIWGLGPVFLLPTGTDELLTTSKWGLGPTGVALRQDGPWTYGALANHVWSVAGSSSRPNVNSSFLQPFVSYNTPDAWSYTLQAEATYDWERGDAQVPVGAFVGKLLVLGGQPIQFAGGPRYYASHFDNGPKGWGLRATMVFLFPK